MLHKALSIVLFTFISFNTFGLDPSGNRKLSVGQSVATVKNLKSIHHASNNAIRIELMQQAVFDAIGKGTSVVIDRKLTTIKAPKKDIENFEKNFDKHVSQAIRPYNANWRRVSEFTFTKIDKRKWHCEVSGYVWTSGANKRTAINSNIGSVDRRKHLTPHYKITRRNFNAIRINANGSDLGSSKKLVVLEEGAEPGSKSKLKGYISVSKSHADYSTGKIVKGFYSISEGDIVEAKYFNELRSGFRYEFSTKPIAKVNLSNIGDMQLDLSGKRSKTEMLVNTHTIMYTTHNLNTNTRWDIGLDIFQVTMPNADTSLYKGMPKFSFGYYIPVIPEVLYLTPHAGLGYLLMFRENPAFVRSNEHGGKINAGVDFGLTATLRLGHIDMIVGTRYRYFRDFPQFTNTYPFIGASYSFSKM